MATWASEEHSSGDEAQATTTTLCKKGTPWTVDEHAAFLQGLEKLGKGNWRGISRFFVPSRTATQVASHAQKHFLRVTGNTKRRSRFTAIEEEMYGHSNKQALMSAGTNMRTSSSSSDGTHPTSNLHSVQSGGVVKVSSSGALPPKVPVIPRTSSGSGKHASSAHAQPSHLSKPTSWFKHADGTRKEGAAMSADPNGTPHMAHAPMMWPHHGAMHPFMHWPQSADAQQHAAAGQAAGSHSAAAAAAWMNHMLWSMPHMCMPASAAAASGVAPAPGAHGYAAGGAAAGAGGMYFSPAAAAAFMQAAYAPMMGYVPHGAAAHDATTSGDVKPFLNGPAMVHRSPASSTSTQPSDAPHAKVVEDDGAAHMQQDDADTAAAAILLAVAAGDVYEPVYEPVQALGHTHGSSSSSELAAEEVTELALRKPSATHVAWQPGARTPPLMHTLLSNLQTPHTCHASPLVKAEPMVPAEQHSPIVKIEQHAKKEASLDGTHDDDVQHKHADQHVSVPAECA